MMSILQVDYYSRIIFKMASKGKKQGPIIISLEKTSEGGYKLNPPSIQALSLRKGRTRGRRETQAS